MDELAAFVAARLDEDEAAATEVHRPRDCGCVDRDGEFSPEPVYCCCGYPARVLREVAAKRAILAAYDEAVNGIGADMGVADALEGVLRHVAAIDSDHPGYKAEWSA